MQIIPLENRKKALQQAIKVLRTGGVVAHPTDTCYGFATMLKHEEGFKLLCGTKRMSPKKPVSILVSSLAQAKKFGVFSKSAEKLVRKYWPGPLTLIVKRKKSVPKFFNPYIDTIGIRMSADSFSNAIIRKIKHPITTTSANISGRQPPYSAQEIFTEFKKRTKKPALIIDGGKLNSRNKPSTVINVVGEGIITIRKGRVRFPQKV